MSEPIAEGWVNTTTAAEITGFSTVYIRILAHRERIEARKVGRDWLIDRASLLAFKAEMDRLGNEKHNPWRDSLPSDGGRKA